MPHVLVAGASGRLGSAVVGELMRRGWHVRALSRSNGVALGDETFVGDLADKAALRASCEGIHTVFSAAGASLSFGLRPGSPTYRAVDYAGNRNLLEAAQAADVHKFVYVSVFSTPELAGLDYVRAHLDFEEALRGSGLRHAIVQPTGFFSSFEMLVRLARLGVAPRIGDGRARTNPISERDLALICADAIERDERNIPVGGPEVLTRQALLEQAFAAVGRKPRFFNVSDRLLQTNRRLVARFDPRLAQLLAFLGAVSQVDVVAPRAGGLRIEHYFRSL